MFEIFKYNNYKSKSVKITSHTIQSTCKISQISYLSLSGFFLPNFPLAVKKKAPNTMY